MSATAEGLRCAVCEETEPPWWCEDCPSPTVCAPARRCAARRTIMKLTVEQADRLAQERPPYPPASDNPSEKCPGPTGWHRPRADNWNRGDRESTCTWCDVAIARGFGDPVWRMAERDAP